MSIDVCATAFVLNKINEALKMLKKDRDLLLDNFDKLLKDLDRLKVQHIVFFHRFQSVRIFIFYESAFSSDS